MEAKKTSPRYRTPPNRTYNIRRDNQGAHSVDSCVSGKTEARFGSASGDLRDVCRGRAAALVAAGLQQDPGAMGVARGEPQCLEAHALETAMRSSTVISRQSCGPSADVSVANWPSCRGCCATSLCPGARDMILSPQTSAGWAPVHRLRHRQGSANLWKTNCNFI
jgi:hypothetical protein